MAGANEPSYGFNRNLHSNTIDPPVQIGARWAQSYPSASSPLSEHLDTYPLLNLAQGVPGHPPPKSFLERIHFESQAASGENLHGYGPVFGEPKLRQAVARDINRVYRTQGSGSRNEVTQDNVAITAGCNLAFAAVAMSIAAPGEALILCEPWYFNHQMTLTSLGIQVARAPAVTVSGEGYSTYNPDYKLIQALLVADGKNAAKTIKGLVLVTPSNPTGEITPPDMIRDLGILCHRHGVALILDETYRDFLLDTDTLSPDEAQQRAVELEDGVVRAHNLFEDTPAGFERNSWEPEWDWRSTLIHLFSFSKSYAIPGHRLGGFVAHSAFLQQKGSDSNGNDIMVFGPTAKALDNLQVTPPRTDTQRALAWAIEDPEHRAWRKQVAHEIRRRRNDFVNGIVPPISPRLTADGRALISSPSTELGRGAADHGWFVESAGAYYVFLKHPFHGCPSEKVAQALAELVGVVVLPGSFFMPPDQPAKSADPDSPASRLRLSVANVSSEKLALLPERLAILSELWHKRGERFDI